MEKKNKPQDQRDPSDQDLPGYPEHSEEEDIYNHEKEEPFGKDIPEESLDEGLDVPGADLDDPDEAVGSEDEENNYYSLGGDDHDDLDEREEG